MKYFILIVFAVISVIFSSCKGQNKNADNIKIINIPIKWEYIDTEGKHVIPCIYDNVNSFRGGLALVEQNEKVGYIDKTGTIVIPVMYDRASLFQGEYAPVELNGKWGYINRRNETVIPFDFDEAYPFSEDIAIIGQNGKYYLIDKNGKIISNAYDEINDDIRSIDNDPFMVKLDEKWGLIDSKGFEVVPPKYQYMSGVDGKNLFSVALNDKWGFIDKNGAEVIAFNYEHIGGFAEGKIGVALDGKWGFIDTIGKVIILFMYDSVDRFSNGFALCRQDREYIFINKSNENVFNQKLKQANRFCDGLAWIESDTQKGFINTEGKKVITADGYDWAECFNEGLSVVSTMYECGVINKKGNFIVPMGIYHLELWEDNQPGSIMIHKNYMNGLLRCDGTPLTPLKYNFIGHFSEGYAAVESVNYAVVDNTGKELLALSCDRVEYIGNGILEIWNGRDNFFLDLQGNKYNTLGKAQEAVKKN